MNALSAPLAPTTLTPAPSRTWTFFEGRWHEGNPALTGPRDHAFWLGSTVFDGGRAFEGVTPDLDRHCARVNDSARALGLAPTREHAEILEIAREGIGKFASGEALYVRPMYWGVAGDASRIAPDPATTRFALSIYVAPLAEPTGFRLTLSPYRRPTHETAPVNAKAGCLYPNNGRALAEARARGFDDCLLVDMLGDIAELGSSNAFLAKDGRIATPVPNGTFLNGITRQRVIALLRKAGRDVVETRLSYRDFFEADEIFATGNASKVLPVTEIDGRALAIGPAFALARRLYWEFAHS